MGTRTYLFSYSYKGDWYGLEIPAESEKEARERIEAIKFITKYDGILEAKIPASVGGWLPRLVVWWNNL